MEPLEVREFRNRIGRAIRELRRQEGISSQALAKVLGVTQPTVSRIENGTTSISAEKLCFLARAFNRPLSYFVGGQSPIAYDEEDVLKAGAVHYGAGHLKCKRTIDVQEHFRIFADFLNAALHEVDDPRFAAAVATTIYRQAADGKLNLTRIITTVQHERLVANLLVLIKLIIDARYQIERPTAEKEKVVGQLTKLSDELGRGRGIDQLKASIADVSGIYIARFINASIGHGK